MLSKSKQEFIEKIGNLAREDMKKTGVLASLTVAQAILESAWGESGLTVTGKALFGIKASKNWKGKVYNAKTKECYDGVNFTEVTASFRAYNSFEESIADHSKLLTSLSRYKKVVGEKDYKKACKEIQVAGYATDPTYAKKLIEIIEAYNLTRFDKNSTVSKNETVQNKKGGKMNNLELIKKLEDVEKNYKTEYAWGCFGCPLTPGIIETKRKQYPGEYTSQVVNNLINAGKKGAFGFDCVNLIKGLLWGWSGDKTKTWGGANYASNGVPDINADMMIAKCKDVSTNFNNIIPGEAVYLPGHIGVYIGGAVVIECTPAWKGGVQKTALLNIGTVAGLNGRCWQKHGKMPYINYAKEQPKQQPNKEVKKMYQTLNEVPDWAKATIKKLIDRKALTGDEKGNLNLTFEMIRIFVVNDRMGLYR